MDNTTPALKGVADMADQPSHALQSVLQSMGWVYWRDQMPPQSEKRILELDYVMWSVNPTWGDQYHRWALVDRMDMKRNELKCPWWMPIPVPPHKAIRAAVAEGRVPEALRNLGWLHHTDELPADSDRPILSLFKGRFSVDVTNGALFRWGLDWERRYGRPVGSAVCLWWMPIPAPPRKAAERLAKEGA